MTATLWTARELERLSKDCGKGPRHHQHIRDRGKPLILRPACHRGAAVRLLYTPGSRTLLVACDRCGGHVAHVPLVTSGEPCTCKGETP